MYKASLFFCITFFVSAYSLDEQVLPDDVLHQIVAYADYETLAQLSLTSKQWYQSTQEKKARHKNKQLALLEPLQEPYSEAYNQKVYWNGNYGVALLWRSKRLPPHPGSPYHHACSCGIRDHDGCYEKKHTLKAVKDGITAKIKFDVLHSNFDPEEDRFFWKAVYSNFSHNAQFDVAYQGYKGKSGYTHRVIHRVSYLPQTHQFLQHEVAIYLEANAKYNFASELFWYPRFFFEIIQTMPCQIMQHRNDEKIENAYHVDSWSAGVKEKVMAIGLYVSGDYICEAEGWGTYEQIMRWLHAKHQGGTSYIRRSKFSVKVTKLYNMHWSFFDRLNPFLCSAQEYEERVFNRFFKDDFQHRNYIDNITEFKKELFNIGCIQSKRECAAMTVRRWCKYVYALPEIIKCKIPHIIASAVLGLRYYALYKCATAVNSLYV